MIFNVFLINKSMSGYLFLPVNHTQNLCFIFRDLSGASAFHHLQIKKITREKNLYNLLNIRGESKKMWPCNIR